MISFIVPTLGRPTLERTISSIECWPTDEIIIVCDGKIETTCRQIISGARRKNIRFVHCQPGNDWGHTERNVAMPLAACRYLAHIDDDDWYAPGTRALMADAIAKTPGRPVLFRMRYPNGITLWRDPNLYCGNVGTPMILIPNMPTKLGKFEPFVGGDCAFLESMKWSPDDIVWRPEVIAMLGHNV